MYALTVVLAVLLGVAFSMAGIGKLAGVKAMQEAQQHLGLPSGIFKMVGALEILGGVGVLLGLHGDLPVIGVLAGVGLVGMTIGATFYHQKAGDSMKEWMPAVVMGSLAIFYIILRIATA